MKEYTNLFIIGAVHSDTSMYDLCPEPTVKRGRPRKKGLKLNIRDFDHTKENDYYIATKKVLTNLSNEPVIILSTFVQKLQNSKINKETLEAINSLIYLDKVS